MSEPVWGLNPVLELLRTRPGDVEEIVVLKRAPGGRLLRLLEEARRAGVPVRQAGDPPPGLPPGARTQGVVAFVRGASYVGVEEMLARARRRGEVPLLVAVDGVTDPQNLGSLIRSAEAAGAHGLIVPRRRAAPVTGTVAKAAAGATAHLPLARVTNLGRTLEELKERGLWVAGLAAEAESTIYQLDLTLPLVWVVGSEGRGIRPGVRDKCDFLAAIPMRGRMESLNAAVAGAIALFETLRQRHHT